MEFNRRKPKHRFNPQNQNDRTFIPNRRNKSREIATKLQLNVVSLVFGIAKAQAKPHPNQRQTALRKSTVQTISVSPIFRLDPLDERVLIVPLENDRQLIKISATTKNNCVTKYNEAEIDHSAAVEFERIEQRLSHVKSVRLAAAKEKLILVRLLQNHVQINIVRKIEWKRITSPTMQLRIDDPIVDLRDVVEPKAKSKNQPGKQLIQSARSNRM